jgi:hypothetical protein
VNSDGKSKALNPTGRRRPSPSLSMDCLY